MAVDYESISMDEAVATVKDIWSKERTPLAKRVAIRKILKEQAYSKITKADLIGVLRWIEGMR